MYLRILPILFVAIFSQITFAEHIGITLQHMVAPLIPGVVKGGELDPKSWMARNVVLLGPQGCTGTFVQGCVMTGGHCATDGVTTRVWRGIEPNKKTGGLMGTGDIVRTQWKGPGDSKKKIAGDIAGDIAFMKLNFKIPFGLGVELSSLAKKAPEAGKVLRVIGYGVNAQKKNKNTQRDENVGFGRRREGKMQFEKIITTSTGTFLEMAKYEDSSTAFGDSGGPLVDENNMIYGTAATVRVDETKLVDNIQAGQHTNIASRRAWIEKTVKELRCDENYETADETIVRSIRNYVYDAKKSRLIPGTPPPEIIEDIRSSVLAKINSNLPENRVSLEIDVNGRGVTRILAVNNQTDRRIGAVYVQRNDEVTFLTQ